MTSGKSWSHIFQNKVCAPDRLRIEAFCMLNCREIPDETTYQKVLEIAKTHRPRTRARYLSSTNASATRTSKSGASTKPFR